ncbi:Replication factor C subunit 1 [Penicillium longicatenatum]|uniref:Replication factor C subunit 1 n=1 Tax=Penicillium longicatenatum TaxID=1561947 RepID=UPI00254663A3|nr:Replication factor C subunit 1 [Penicillium longicatenatum]KAJ5651368.1 Replication factor C subunit 1 [Penicillium longicatenatum]
MPSDIRSFFGGKPPQSSAESPKPAKTEDPSATRKRRSRKVVDDSDDEEDVPAIKAPTPKAKLKSQPKSEETKGEPTTTSDYFASSKKRGKPTKTENPVTKSETQNDTNTTVESPVKPPKRGASKKVTTIVDDDEGLGGDDVFATEYKRRGKGDDDYVEGGNSDDDDDDNDAFEVSKVKPSTASRRTQKKQPTYTEDDDDDFEVMEVKPPSASKRTQKKQPTYDEDDDVVMDELPTPAPKAAQKGRKRKSEALVDKDEDGELGDVKKPASRSKASKGSDSPAAKKSKAPPKKKTKEEVPENKEIQDIFDSIPTVRPPTPPQDNGEKKKWKFGDQRSRTPPTTGTKEIPVGAENCLAGLAFVFTGVQETLGREEGQELVKRYGGKVTGAPSSKTSYVVLGSDAGPSKLQTIAKHNLKTISEDGLFELIRRLPANGGSGKAAAQYEAKQKAEEDKIQQMAREIDAEEKKKADEKKKQAAATSNASNASGPPASKGPPIDDQLWTTKYAPTSTSMICGNKAAVEKIQNWLRNWRKSAKMNFKNAGKDGSGVYRTIMIHGPPGIGKTTAAHMVAKLEGYDIIESNASDTRSKKLVETGTLGVLDTTSLQGYFAGDGKNVDSNKKNVCLIMDEVDGMSAGDRGGVGALAAIAKKTSVPLILICNERKQPKMKPFDFVTFDVPFRRPTVEQIRARLSTICFREKLKIPPPVLDSLIEGTHADIRQVINMLSTAKLDQESLSFDKGKEMSKAWEKHIILKPWDIVSKILSAQMFSPSSTSTLNDKIELYFNDHEFSYLMLQENYLKTRPTLAGNYHDKEKNLKLLELADNAASSISEGDLVDRMIHGTQQQWSLMPTHAVFSFVRPASFQFGNMTERASFAGWLGQNSKQGKLSRFVKEIQGHMRLRTSGNRDEIRQQYLPLLWEKTIRRMMDEGKDSVEDIIDFMDSYYLTRDDFDSMLELGLGPMDQSNVKLETQTKSTFTRLYNSRSHPMPFMKASNVVAPAKKGPKEKPDIEDALEESDEEEVVEEAKDDDEELDLKKDKYVSQPKKKAAKGAAKGKKTTKKAANDDFIDDDEEKPKKARKGKAKAKG